MVVVLGFSQKIDRGVRRSDGQVLADLRVFVKKPVFRFPFSFLYFSFILYKLIYRLNFIHIKRKIRKQILTPLGFYGDMLIYMQDMFSSHAYTFCIQVLSSF